MASPTEPRRVIEVFADITCPFTHVGLKRVVAQLAELDRPADLLVRAWPLEWVNGAVMEADSVAGKAAVLSEQLGLDDDFRGFRTDTWPTTTIPALNLAASATSIDRSTGLAVNLALRAALFEQGRDVSDPHVLKDIADAHGLPEPGTPPHPGVEADYAEGQRRGVRGSPDFWLGSTEFFCPSLSISHDDAGGLLTEFDPEGLSTFIDSATT